MGVEDMITAARVALTRAWATPVYRRLHDPDGRPRALRRRRTY